MPPSSRGLGRGPFKAKTGIRIPLGAYLITTYRLVFEITQRDDVLGDYFFSWTHLPVGRFVK